MEPLLRRSAATLYDDAALSAAATVIRAYSTSFALSTRLLREPVRSRVHSVYALVRVADEVVDGAASGSGLADADIGAALDAYEHEVERALHRGFSTDLIIHAFAQAARATGITPELTRPFFASMRMDLHRGVHTPETFASYVYGSAEVVGLMCVRVFSTGAAPGPRDPGPALDEGARSLGAAFQKINFLRDLHADSRLRGRTYFPGVEPSRLTAAQRDAILDDVDADLARARRAIPLLPASSRAAVRAAHDLFCALAGRLRSTPASLIAAGRVRVSDPRKAWIVARAMAAEARRLTPDGEREGHR